MSRIKDEIENIAKELGEYAASEEAKGQLYVAAKVADVRDYLRGLWSRPVALGAVIVALALGGLIGWSCNESRHGNAEHAAAVEAVR